ncbi:MAG: hypothetical protein CM1200mP2_26540 [Planctomycetaceae bacterium]|nr:MAG: hypothetical protein CM1200mP2_26540 [Planctomycetaceae bacterium]
MSCGSGQVGDGTSDPQDPVVSPGRKAHLLHRQLQQLLGWTLQPAVTADLGWGHVAVGSCHRGADRIGFGKSLDLHDASHLDLLGHHSTVGPRRVTSQFVERNSGHLDVDIDPVQQGAADPGHVTFDLRDPAVTIPARISPEPTRAWVHRRHQHQVRRKGHAAQRPGNRDLVLFERLPHYLQRPPVEFGQLVQEQNSVMRQADLSRRRTAATSHQSRLADRVVRGAEGTGQHQGASRGQPSHDAPDPARLEALPRGQLGQDATQPAGQQRLAGSRRTDQQQVVSAGGGHHDSPLGHFLSLHIRVVHLVTAVVPDRLLPAEPLRDRFRAIPPGIRPPRPESQQESHRVLRQPPPRPRSPVAPRSHVVPLRGRPAPSTAHRGSDAIGRPGPAHPPPRIPRIGHPEAGHWPSAGPGRLADQTTRRPWADQPGRAK